jgi:hypothetical protein
VIAYPRFDVFLPLSTERITYSSSVYSFILFVLFQRGFYSKGFLLLVPCRCRGAAAEMTFLRRKLPWKVRRKGRKASLCVLDACCQFGVLSPLVVVKCAGVSAPVEKPLSKRIRRHPMRVVGGAAVWIRRHTREETPFVQVSDRGAHLLGRQRLRERPARRDFSGHHGGTFTPAIREHEVDNRSRLVDHCQCTHRDLNVMIFRTHNTPF